jgi:arylsulfatase A-like enzyme
MATAAAAAQQSSKRSPNVIFLLVDDLGWKDTGYNGGPMETPNIDRMARGGVRMEHAYSFPLCSPTRSAFMTGRNPMRLGIAWSVVRPWASYGLDPKETTIADLFRGAGYQTAMCGKWHLGHANKKLTPNARGFDHFYGHMNGAIDYFSHERDGGIDWQRNGKSVKEEGYTTFLLAAEAERWIQKRDKQRPFFLYMPFNAPHTPLQAPQNLIDKYAGKVKDERRRTFVAMVDALDTAIGRVLATVEREGIANETLIVFWSDNGGPRGQGADNGPLRMGKATVFEGGIRVPAVFYWPGKLKPGESSQVMAIWDVLPTLAAACGITPKTARPLDGVNVWEEVAGGRTRERENLFWAVHESAARQLAVRDGKWKYVRIDPHGGGQSQDLLFDLAADPNEKNNLAGNELARVKAMHARAEQWAATHPKAEVFRTLGPHPGFVSPKDWATLAVE